jgi:mannose-6-phosphate isomerase-like protein (cupin superfamily)
MNKRALALLCGCLIGTVSTFAQGRKIAYCSLPADSPNPQPGCYLLATQKLNAQPARPLYWHLYTGATPDAESTVVTAFGKTWLFRIAPDDWKPRNGQRVDMVGPLMLGPASDYVARYMQNIAPIVPDSHQTPVHTHPGAEAWYVVAGAQCMQTPAGTVILRAGQSAFVSAGIPMTLGQSGTETRQSFILVLHEASSPWNTRTEDWKPESACPGSTGPMPLPLVPSNRP